MVRHDIHLFTLFTCLHILEDVGIDTLHDSFSFLSLVMGYIYMGK